MTLVAWRALCVFLCVITEAVAQKKGDEDNNKNTTTGVLFWIFVGAMIMLVPVVFALKDQGAPTGNFVRFSQENREAVKARNPGISFGDTSKLLGAMWRKLDPSEKAKYKPYDRKTRAQ